MPEPKIRLNLSTLGQLQQPPNPGIGWVGPERPAESWADIAADPLSALFDIGRGAVTGDAPPGMNLQGLGSVLAAALPVAQGAKSLRALTKAAAIEDAAQQGIKAYHGSPHDFDQFSLSKIGTGEGAQAYGHGLYFAENENVAKEYKKALTDWEVHEPSGRVVSSAGSAKTFAGSPSDRALAWVQDAASRNDISDPLRFARGNAAKALKGDADEKAILGQIDEWIKSGAQLKPGGRMYEVQIHASPDQFLDWDKPLSEQSEHVQDALARLGVKRGMSSDDIYARLVAGGWSDGLAQKYASQQAYEATGAHAYRELAAQPKVNGLEQLTSYPQATDVLKSQGIPGIRYLDAGSRMPPDVEFLKKQVANIEERLPLARASSDPEAMQRHAASLEQAKKELAAAMAKGQTRNFVIFDDSLVSILKKYGVALPVIEGLRERAKQNGGVISRKDVDGLEQ